MKSRSFVLAAALMAGCAAPALADVQAGQRAYAQGNYSFAYDEFEQAAERGDPGAQFYLAEMYRLGQGVPQNYVRAHSWYNVAAALGHSEAAQARDVLAAQMSPQQRAAAQQMAARWQQSQEHRSALAGAPYSVENLQRSLNALGYDAGPADGQMGPRTRAAIVEFQRDTDLAVTGQATQGLYTEVQRSLGTRTAAAVSSASGSTAAGYSVKAIQTELNSLGYDAGPEDGIMGSSTRSAIRAFQRDAGLSVTGTASQSVYMAILDKKNDRAAQTNSTQTGSFQTSPADSGYSIRGVQTKLNSLGYDAGPEDGLMGSSTRSAIRAFQRDQGIGVDGTASAALDDRLDTALQRQQVKSTTDAGDGSLETPDRETLAQIETLLARRGYPISVVNGQADAETAAAIRAYQQDSGLAVTGTGTVDLLARLRDERYHGRALIQEVQYELNEKGYEVGGEDGVAGPGTRRAVRQFQSAMGVQVDGEVDRQLLDQLRDASITPPADRQAQGELIQELTERMLEGIGRGGSN